jgi:hypothetical protein
MATIYEVKVKSGTYEKDGQQKIRYQQIGIVIETKKGLMLKLNAMPITDEHWQGWCYLFTPKEDDKKSSMPEFDDAEF